MPSNKRRLEQLIAEGKYVPPPIVAADGKTELRQVLAEWNEIAREITSSLRALTDEASADDAVPRLQELAKRYQAHYQKVWRSGVEPAKLGEILAGHLQLRMNLELALRQLKFQQRKLFDRLRLVAKKLTPCDIDLSSNFS